VLYFCDFAHRKRERNEDYDNDDCYSDYSDDDDDNNVYHVDDVVPEILKIKWLSLQDDDMKFKWYDMMMMMTNVITIDNDDGDCHSCAYDDGDYVRAVIVLKIMLMIWKWLWSSLSLWRWW
jgi:hypothetical protein